MIYPNSATAVHAYLLENPNWELTAEAQSQINLGAQAMTAEAFSSLYGQAMLDAGDSKAGKDKLVYRFVSTFRYFSNHSGYAALITRIRALGPELEKISAEHGVATPKPQAIVKAIFPLGTVLCMESASDVNELMTLALDSLMGVLEPQRWESVLARVTSAEMDTHGAALHCITHELQTHDAKLMFVSAKGRAFIPHQQDPSRFLTASAFPTIATWRMGAGKMQYGGPGGYLLTAVIEIPGIPPFPLFHAFTKSSLRQQLRQQGITAMDELPMWAVTEPALDLTFGGSVRMKLSALESLELVVMPSASQLAAFSQLADRVVQVTQLMGKAKARQYLQECLGCHPGLIEVLAADTTKAARAKALEQVKTLAEQGDAKAAKFSVRKLNWLLYAGPDVQVVPITSKAQLAGAVYNDLLPRGVPRFAAAEATVVDRSPRAIRRYFAAERQFDEMLNHAFDEVKADGDPLDNYRVGVKWLGARVQSNIRDSYVGRTAHRFMQVLGQLRAWVHLQDEHKASLHLDSATPIQLFLLKQPLSDQQIKALAQASVRLLVSNEAQAHQDLVARVSALLEKTWHS
ncbi:hypothetical protein [Comamonas thiooxydans]|uniref:hypothetical protein n=1 Tax=Comamonas thiooxydans TaxID=363952 RepID=UPI000B4217E1|nr:hypothetical protein [Comamonas thiooxydans]